MPINLQTKVIRSHAKQTGFSLVELSIALAIGSLVILAAISGVRKIQDGNNANALLTQMASSSVNMARTAQALNNFTIYDDTAGMGKMGIFESSALIKTQGVTTQIRNAFGGFVWTHRNTGITNGVPINGGNWYTVTNVPNSACAEVVAGMNSSSVSIVVSAPGQLTQTTGATPTNISGIAPKISSNNNGDLDSNALEISCSNTTSLLKDIHALQIL